MGIMQTAECYIAAKQQDKAVALYNRVAPWFEEHEAFKTRYDEIAK
jgi:hypothetical protein